jgi:dCTP deaminase
LVPPHGFALAHSVEYLRIPENVLGIVLGKATYARCGLTIQTSPLEPGWEGNVTLFLSNSTPLPIKVYANEGIAQVVFLEGETPPDTTYATRSGRYQGQRGLVLPRA